MRTRIQKTSNVLEAQTLGILNPTVSSLQEYYQVDLGEGIIPRQHLVYHLEMAGPVCLCELGSKCPAVMAVQTYLLDLACIGEEERAKRRQAQAFTPTVEAPPLSAIIHPDDFLLRFIPCACPECGGAVKPDARLNGRTDEGMVWAGWQCENGGARCFLRHKMARSLPTILAVRRANPDPYLIPPSHDYPGVRLSEFGQPRIALPTETQAWFEAQHAVALPMTTQTEALNYV